MDCPKRSAVADLPEDAMVEILTRVPTRSVYRSKCVAKAWRDLMEDPSHRKRLPQTLQGFFSMDKEIYGRGSGEHHIGFTSLLARSATLGIDRRLSFLTKLSGIKILTLADSCNGLFLFKHGLKSGPSDRLGYVLWYEECQLVSFEEGALVDEDEEENDSYVHDYWGRRHQQRYNGDDEEDEEEEGYTTKDVYRISVHIYSSETGTWTHNVSDWEEELGQLEEWRHQCQIPQRGPGCAVLNGVLHFIISDLDSDQDQIAAVDVQGATRRIIAVPPMVVRKRWLQPQSGFVAQSQGRLHYIYQTPDAQLSIWVLEDTQEWVLKHSVSFIELFGNKRHAYWNNNKYHVVAMHPDGNVVFIVRGQKLISYGMDHKKVGVISTSEDNFSTGHIVSYAPCFLELPALTNKH
ncbi:unnamed protein product [Urochloa decumbens]|uniref:F-box domain-containing protein n=1 Tax=Urochloa decumbens TaxID=240449 RepID=A0ABC8WSU4_9POAL